MVQPKRTSMGAGKKRRSILSKEEKIERLKAARAKYNGRTTRQATSKPKPNTESHASSSSTDPDFETDPEALEMIRTGNVRIPVNRVSNLNGRPSVATRPSIAPRFSVAAGRQSVSGRPSIVATGRPSIARITRATVNEPRVSLLPLGINVFEASESQKQQLSIYKKSQSQLQKSGDDSSLSDCTTPSKFNVFGTSQMSTRKRTTIRFMENVIPEQRESHDPTEELATPPVVKHSPKDLPVPRSILSSAKKLKSRKVISFDQSPIKPSENKSTIVEEMMRLAEKLQTSDGEVNKEMADSMRKIEEILQKEVHSFEVLEALQVTTNFEEHVKMEFIGDEPQIPKKTM